MQGNSGTTHTTNTDRHWGRWVVMAVAATAITITAVFTLTRADAAEGPTHQRVVVTSEDAPLELLGGLGYAGFVGFEPSEGRYGTVERVMKVNEEPDVLASEINRTMGAAIEASVEDLD